MTKFTRKASVKKRRLYVSLLILHAFVVMWPMLVQELILKERISMSSDTMGIIESVVALALIVVNCLFIREFITNRFIFYGFCVISTIGVIFSTIGHVSSDLTANLHAFKNYNLISGIMVLTTLCIVFGVAVKDIFRLKHDMTYSLIGAANMFLLIGSIFSFIINISGTVFDDMLVPLSQIAEIDIYANKLAFYTLGGVELPFPHVDPFIKHILVIESICANLFVVMIIGRLLSK